MNKKRIFTILSALIIVSVGQSLIDGTNVYAAENLAVATDTAKNATDAYKDFVFDKEKGQIISYTGDAEILNIPEEIDGVKVRSIYGQYLSMPDGTMQTIFKNPEKIKKVVIPASVESIEPFAFNGCTNLKEVEISEGLKTIGEFAFSNTAIEKLHIPDSVKSIGQNAFSNINALKEINIPKGIKSIDKDILSDSINVEKIDMADDISFEKYSDTKPVFSGTIFQKNHTDSNGFYVINGFLCGYYGEGGEITIPDNVKTMADNLFAYNKDIRKVTIGKNLAKISKGAFYNCVNLKEADFSNSNAAEIGDSAFFKTSIEKISLGSSVRYLGHLSFYDCVNLLEVNIDNGLSRVQDDTFNNVNCVINMAGIKKSINDFNYVNFIFDKETGTISRYFGSAIILTIPNEINGVKVNKIEVDSTLKQRGYGILGDNNTVENIVFSDDCSSITICREAFKNSKYVTSILLRGVKKIEPFAFYGNEHQINFGYNYDICISKYAFTNTLFEKQLAENKITLSNINLDNAYQRYDKSEGNNDKDANPADVIISTTTLPNSGDNTSKSIIIMGLLGSALIVLRGLKRGYF